MTGAAYGIGEYCAIELLNKGAKVNEIFFLKNNLPSS